VARAVRKSSFGRFDSGDDGRAVVRKHRPDYLIVLYMGLLMLFGLITIYAVGPQQGNLLNNVAGANYSDNYFFIKQLTSLALALAAFVTLALLPYKLLLKHGLLFLGLGLLACLVLLLGSHTAIAECTLGACRWFNLGPLGSLQPAEILKFGTLVYVAVFLGKKMKEGDVNNWKETLMPIGVVTVIGLIFIVVIQKDMGTGISLLAIVATMIFVAGVNLRIGLTLLAAAAILGILFTVMAPHRLERIETYLRGDDTTSTDGSDYQVQNAKIALGTGWWTGLGIGNSIQATGYLPEAINDSVFAIMGETFGFLGVTVVIVLFVALLMRLLRVMDHLVDQRIKLLVAGVFGWLAAHVILNIAAMIGLIPLTGITLPLLSFGGTSMLFITAGLGLVFQLSRFTIHPSRLKEVDNENSRSRRGLGRTRYASRSGA